MELISYADLIAFLSDSENKIRSWTKGELMSGERSCFDAVMVEIGQ